MPFFAFLRQEIAEVFRFSLFEPEASLLVGTVLGIKEKMPFDFYEALRRTGTLHIVVVSGFNISLISGRLLDWLAPYVGRKKALVLAFLMIWFYVSIVGFSPPVVRAAIMASFVYLSQFLGKVFNAWRALIVSALIMILINPNLVVDISFQLSFSAMAGLILFKDSLKRLEKLPLIGLDLAESFSAQLLVWPIIAYHFGRISWLAPLINIFVLWTVPKITAFGVLGGILGMAVPLLALPLIWLSYPLLFYFVEAIYLFNRLPFLEIKAEWFNLWLLAGYYFFVLAVLMVPQKANRERF